jgi:kynurenine formamidase
VAKTALTDFIPHKKFLMRTTEKIFVDLTHVLLPSVPSWDGSCGFLLEVDVDYNNCPPLYLFRTQKINSRAGIGTHMDAPAHCFPSAKTIDALALEDLIVPCIVIKLEEPADERYLLGFEAIKKFETKHGDIPPNAFVIVCTGWGRYWAEPEKYRNNLQFPSIHEEAAMFLLERRIAGLGIDTLSADAGGKVFPVHRVILGAGKYLVENIANAESLPPTGATALVMPTKISEATEAPIRLVAMIDEK